MIVSTHISTNRLINRKQRLTNKKIFTLHPLINIHTLSEHQSSPAETHKLIRLILFINARTRTQTRTREHIRTHIPQAHALFISYQHPRKTLPLC